MSPGGGKRGVYRPSGLKYVLVLINVIVVLITVTVLTSDQKIVTWKMNLFLIQYRCTATTRGKESFLFCFKKAEYWK